MSSKRVIIVINATLIMCYKNNLMLKVIFKVEKLVLKLTNIECEILAKKDNLTIPLSPLLTIKNGEVLIGA
jgi:poly(3-hydroxyalkanoate) synthetase